MWRPMDTAPKDGTVFLAYMPHWALKIWTCRYSEEAWQVLGCGFSVPSLWMPLPPLPSTSAENQRS